MCTITMPHTHESTLAAILKSGRQAKGWSQRELADRLGIEQPAISRYETGEREPRLDDLVVIVRTLGIGDRVFQFLLRGRP